MARKKQESDRVTVVLKKDHRHAGKDYRAGDSIEVTEFQKKWLKEHEVI